MKAEAMLNVK